MPTNECVRKLQEPVRITNDIIKKFACKGDIDDMIYNDK